ADIWSVGIILYTMLCGHPPFRGRKEKDIKEKIINGSFGFPPEEFNKFSPFAISFIKSLLTYDPLNRPSAEQALKDPWLIASLKSNDDDSVNIQIVENLTKFQSTNTLQKATLSYISHQLSQSNELKRLTEEFNKIDKNKDGVLSKEELIDCLSQVYSKEIALQKVDDIFNEIDFNGDGTINYSEFIAVNTKKENVNSIENLRKAFNLFDLDGNGFITIDELKETISIDLGSASWEEVVKEVDRNGDNMISFDEFKIMMEKIAQMKDG
ncbi:MAG: EF-hand domain-containing protein, partial [archaeon]|nr:EF-hand domain-containing protein [archaeon]